MQRVPPSDSSHPSHSRQKHHRQYAHRPPPPSPPAFLTLPSYSRHTREQLLKALEILGPLGTPLPPQLPSPPASRQNSPPSAGPKRKLDADAEQSQNKKPRTTLAPDPPRRKPPPPEPQPDSSSHSRPPAPNLRSDPSEDGELREEPTTVVRDPIAVLENNVPVRRPRRGRAPPSHTYHDQLHDKYHALGRLLKYSGDTRLWSTYPPRDPGYRPLLNPPHPESPYHKFGNIIGRLELIDALICFAYSLWNKDYGRRCCHGPSWGTIESFLSYSKHKWEQVQDSADEREKAFIGLIWMLEAFIHGRKFTYSAKVIDKENDALYTELRAIWRAELEREEAKAAREANSSPNMLPSPESIAGSSSANSTPINRSDGTPSTAARNPSKPSTQQQSASAAAARQNEIPPSHIKVSVDGKFIVARKSQSGGLNAAHWCMDNAQRFLTLPVMAKHFPRTFSRMVYSTLSATDEHEPDIEDEEGELFWPGQLVTGEGIGWVCTMGKAMVKEFGKTYHYLGMDGVIPKPDPVETPSSAGPPAAPTGAESSSSSAPVQR
ncbi:hypothetical protein BXZ70DRAFT_36400 [Cristinia sonorae]|uniref:Uncharacterized protein n=1 Tax=Cristinia sonorae TaxID=1940300 RepID=A0A8K0V0T1_9AGAR|nr:hypothetical protein BXZ70DRAFT_36400 [Cristinia sonorae]